MEYSILTLQPRSDFHPTAISSSRPAIVVSRGAGTNICLFSAASPPSCRYSGKTISHTWKSDLNPPQTQCLDLGTSPTAPFPFRQRRRVFGGALVISRRPERMRMHFASLGTLHFLRYKGANGPTNGPWSQLTSSSLGTPESDEHGHSATHGTHECTSFTSPLHAFALQPLDPFLRASDRSSRMAIIVSRERAVVRS